VTLDVVESMLGDIGNTSIGVFPALANLRHQLTGEQFDHGGFTGTYYLNEEGTRND
jgi:hypothetical protein